MSSHIDFRLLPNNLPSLCIPRVFANINEKRIRCIFNDLNMGEILRIDIVSKTTEKGDKFNRVFVHFKQWFNNENSDTARERLLNGKEIKIIYDDPWFWKVSAYRESNNNKAPRTNTEKHDHKKASLQFDSDEDIPKNAEQRPTQYQRPTQGQRPTQNQRPTQGYQGQRPIQDKQGYNKYQSPRQNQENKPREEVKKMVPSSPDSSPPRVRKEESFDIPSIDYGDCLPVIKKRKQTTNKPLEIEIEIKKTEKKEEGEIDE